MRARVSLAVCLLLCLSAKPADGPRLPAGALPVPLIRQANEYGCGAAALLAILYYWQVEDCGECELYDDLGTTEEDGTTPEKILEVAIAKGLKGELRKGLEMADLRAGLERGDTIVLDLQAWRDDKTIPWRDDWDDGHYVVLVGLDERYIYAMDPSTGAAYTYLAIPEFLERWHDGEPGRTEAERLVHGAIFIRGTKALRTVPAPLSRLG